MGVLSNCKEKCRSGMADSVSTKAPLLSAYRFAPLSANRSSVVNEEESRAKRGGHFECPCLPEKFRYFRPIAPLISIGPANKSPAIPNKLEQKRLLEGANPTVQGLRFVP